MEKGDKVQYQFPETDGEQWCEAIFEGDNRLYWFLLEVGEIYTYLKDRVAVRPTENIEVNKMKQWETIHTHNGHEIKVLNNAEVGDKFGYKVEPGISKGVTYLNIGEAVEAIERSKRNYSTD